MRILMGELRKIWNLRVLLLITAMGVLVFFAFLYPAIKSYNSFHGIYGDYQKEMFDKYGDTLEPEELNDFDIPGKRTTLEREENTIIVGESLFAEYRIYSISDMNNLIVFDEKRSISEQEEFQKDYAIMRNYLYGKWFEGPSAKLQCLEALERRYILQPEGGDNIGNYILHDTRPVVRRQAAEYVASYNNNLIRYDLTNNFSLYATITAVFSIVAVLALIMPLLTTDRSQKLHYMQYSSKTGRKIIKIQLIATLFSAIALALILSTIAYITFIISTDAPKYLNAHIADFSTWSFYMYNITFIQYIFILLGLTLALCSSAACVSFILSRFSVNIVTMMIKAVPVGGAIAGIAVLTANMALSNGNIIFSSVFRGHIDYAEIILVATIAIISIVATIIVVSREKRVDLM